MSREEDAELQLKIARLAGAINRHKTNDNETPYHAYGRGTYQTATQIPARGGHQWTPARGTPYGYPRGRGQMSRGATHRNRTLVINSNGNQDPTPHEASKNSTQSGWVTKRDRHMQLINNSVYEQKTQERSQAMEQTRKQKAVQREEREKAKLNSHFLALSNQQRAHTQTKTQTAKLELFVGDVRFLVAAGGSKLIKANDELNLTKTTPKHAYIGGVAFHRSKHGNLYRAGIIKTKRDLLGKRISKPCPQFSTTGSSIPSLATDTERTCAKGPACRYEHDANNVAICKDFLLTGKCQAGSECDLSHSPTAERVPACLHFLRGNCTNPECRYAHVRVNPGAPVCRAFASLGFCPAGAACPDRHIHECPDYANKGVCRNKRCRLPHVDRAGQLRKAAAVQSEGGRASDDDAASDVDSDESGVDSDDFDSDDYEDVIAQASDTPGELSQQVDFVKF